MLSKPYFDQSEEYGPYAMMQAVLYDIQLEITQIKVSKGQVDKTDAMAILRDAFESIKYIYSYIEDKCRHEHILNHIKFRDDMGLHAISGMRDTC